MKYNKIDQKSIKFNKFSIDFEVRNWVNNSTKIMKFKYSIFNLLRTLLTNKVFNYQKLYPQEKVGILILIKSANDKYK